VRMSVRMRVPVVWCAARVIREPIGGIVFRDDEDGSDGRSREGREWSPNGATSESGTSVRKKVEMEETVVSPASVLGLLGRQVMPALAGARRAGHARARPAMPHGQWPMAARARASQGMCTLIDAPTAPDVS
jgi:hypothetical protein